ITQRALRVLRTVDLIACEDTRHTRKLLAYYGIERPTISYHEHNERERAAEIVARIEADADVALVTDAGTPAISDPGYRLVHACIERGLRVVPVPGPAAFVAALVASGLPTDRFFFGGFLPAKKNARRAALAEARAIGATLIFYEAPHRLAEALADAREVLGEREAVVARELTKLHEEIVRGRLSELAERFGKENARGEVVLVIDRTEIAERKVEAQPNRSQKLAERVAQLEADGADFRTALKRAARELGIQRDEAYRMLAAERDGRTASRTKRGRTQ
ncbi:16S rRNA (cytidine(1402)-2'-O)-methyltransferase, partial [Pyrinomonas sp.]|uniref:16S rRNA (cytidine(1402)-2'-O)-methyltransferase n=1 Tax=Pyrinomonas sp. TaxID=2080306 RepID=UPI00332D5A58